MNLTNAISCLKNNLQYAKKSCCVLDTSNDKNWWLLDDNDVLFIINKHVLDYPKTDGYLTLCKHGIVFISAWSVKSSFIEQ